MKIDTLDGFTRAYIEAALWSSTGNDGEPLEKSFAASDIAPEALAELAGDCARFQNENGEDLKAFTADDARNALDFWLVRNGHGSGFLDHVMQMESHFYSIGERLTEAAKAFGECNLYVGDDGRIYI